MSYINYNHLYKKGLNDKDYHILQKIFQKETTLLEPHIKDFKKLLDLELIQYLKGKENTVEGVRISKKGKTFLNQLEDLNYTDELGVLIDKLIELYEINNKDYGNKLEIQSRLGWFISQTGFGSSQIMEIVEKYLDENREYTLKLENLIWRPQSQAFSVHKNLKDSRLFEMFRIKWNLDESFYIKDKKGVEMDWLSKISSLEPSKKLKKELYFTGSYESDMQHIVKLKNKYFRKIRKL